jgi:hypothetical protein
MRIRKSSPGALKFANNGIAHRERVPWKGSTLGNWVYTDWESGEKMEIPIEVASIRPSGLPMMSNVTQDAAQVRFP